MPEGGDGHVAVDVPPDDVRRGQQAVYHKHRPGPGPLQGQGRKVINTDIISQTPGGARATARTMREG